MEETHINTLVHVEGVTWEDGQGSYEYILPDGAKPPASPADVLTLVRSYFKTITRINIETEIITTTSASKTVYEAAK